MNVSQELEDNKLATSRSYKKVYGSLTDNSKCTLGFETTAKQRSLYAPNMRPSDQVSISEIDRFQAWLTLSFVFINNATTLGSLKIYALIFQDVVSQKYYTREEASWPIATATSIQNLAGLLTPLLALRFSWRSIEIVQTLLFVAANFGAYLSHGLAFDILFLGIIQGVALSLRYNMNVLINNEYFSKYKTTAMGISLAGSTCGVFILKPIITHVLDGSGHQFRNAFLTLAIIMSFNLILNPFIRKPRTNISSDATTIESETATIDAQQVAEGWENLDHEDVKIISKVLVLLKNPCLHCIWIMQTIYFYLSRTYTIFIVDYGVDVGFRKDMSRNLLNFWVYGELAGRFLLGSFVDSKLLSLKWNIILVNILVAGSGFSLIVEPQLADRQNQTTTSTLSLDLPIIDALPSREEFANSILYWIFGISVSLVGALSSLLNMLIVPFGQEYIGKKDTPWAFAVGSVVTGLFLMLRPSLIGLSRDYYESYDLLIIVMSSASLIFALLFAVLEPSLRRVSFRNNAT